MFKNLGNFKYTTEEKELKINLGDLNSEVNFLENFIIFKKKNNIKVYDRICDHAGGKIISKDGDSICPVHMWKFNPSTGLYNNGIKKKEADYSIQNEIIKIKEICYLPEIKKFKKKINTEIRFINHAFLKISGDDFSFSTDPWAIGPAFNTGWWLKYPTKNDWLDQLNNSNFIYISHNHPDHLHPLTLSKVNKNIPIVVPNFITRSTELYIKDLGFKNIQVLDFNVQYNLTNTNLNISILKSTDFREDSGIYFSNGEFAGLLSVDANVMDFSKLPNVNFYGSSFASGASGYPYMYENFKFKEQLKISLKDKNFEKIKVNNRLKKLLPDYYMPYAGFFTEKLKRDNKIYRYNKKNSVDDYLKLCESNKIELLNVLKKDVYKFYGNKLIKKENIDIQITKDLKPETYLDYYKKEYNKVDETYIKNYFLESKFKDNLLLYIFLSDDKFKLQNKNYLINFSKSIITFCKIDRFSKKVLKKDPHLKKLVLKIRKESFLNTIYNKLPWEDLSVGFQCKVLREPNLYNVKFWHHFTNTYTTSMNVRSVTECASCESLSHFFDNQIYQN